MLLCLLAAGMMWTPAVHGALPTHPAHLAAPAPDDVVITGTVEDADGPMIGATVKVAGTNNGTVTDFDGNFQIKCKPGDLLEVSYVGYSTITVKAQQGMTIRMDEDKTVLSEVVVTTWVTASRPSTPMTSRT